MLTLFNISGYIYKDLSMKWVLNESTVINYGIVTLEAVDTLYIKNIQLNHSGDWYCEISQEDLNFSWITSMYWINVRKKPNFIIYMMEDTLTKPIFGWMIHEAVVVVVVIFFVIILIVLVVLGTKFYLNLKKPTIVYEPISTSETE